MKVAQGRHNLFFRYFYLFSITIRLTHSFPMHPFYSPCKHQKTVRFSDEGVEKGCIGNEWVKILWFPYDLKPTRVSDVVIDHLWKCQEKRNLTGKILVDIILRKVFGKTAWIHVYSPVLEYTSTMAIFDNRKNILLH